MCTVTYIPKGNRKFLLASNRDENHQRSTNTVVTKLLGTQKLLFPVDPISGGSWIATSSFSKVACVLNGAFKKHQHSPPYRKSRGLVLLDFFQSASAQRFADQYDFDGIEPFTMIMCESSGLFEFRWDGHMPNLTRCDSRLPQIWSSTTLYDETAQQQRNTWFQSWLNQCSDPSMLDLVHFHQYGGEQDHYNGFVMNRQGKVQTISVTAINKKESHASIYHHDLIADQFSKHQIDFSEDEVVESV